MVKKTKDPEFNSLISSPWGKSPQNSYYGDPGLNQTEQHGLEHIERDKIDDQETEKVAILGYN